MLIRCKRSRRSLSSPHSIQRTLHVNIHPWPPLVVPIVSTGFLTFGRKEGAESVHEPGRLV